MNRISVALIAMAAIFLYFFGLVIPNILVMSLYQNTDQAPAVMAILPPFTDLLPVFLALISLAGCTLCLKDRRAEGRHWHFGIPLWVAMAVAAVSLLLPRVILAGGGIPFSADPIYLTQNAQSAALFLLAPSSALFFWSQKDLLGGVSGHVDIALLISILSAILLYGLLVPVQYAPGEHVSMSMYEPVCWIYLILGLPVVGALYIALGLRRSVNSIQQQRDGESP